MLLEQCCNATSEIIENYELFLRVTTSPKTVRRHKGLLSAELSNIWINKKINIGL